VAQFRIFLARNSKNWHQFLISIMVSTTLEEGQIGILKHMDDEAVVCAFLYAPVGLPSPWGWAPLSFLGAEGRLLDKTEDLPIRVTSMRLRGRWLGRLMHLLNVKENEKETYLKKSMAELAGSYHNYMWFEMVGFSKYRTTLRLFLHNLLSPLLNRSADRSSDLIYQFLAPSLFAQHLQSKFKSYPLLSFI